MRLVRHMYSIRKAGIFDQGRQEAAALARRVQKEDTRSAEEKDQAAFAASLDHLDSSKPLMEQLGV